MLTVIFAMFGKTIVNNLNFGVSELCKIDDNELNNWDMIMR
jgi:hypothetical protein